LLHYHRGMLLGKETWSIIKQWLLGYWLKVLLLHRRLI
jgi:hypothetical protein